MSISNRKQVMTSYRSSWQKCQGFSQFQLRNWILVKQWCLCLESSAGVVFKLTKTMNSIDRKGSFYWFSCFSPIMKGSWYQNSIKFLHLLLFFFFWDMVFNTWAPFKICTIHFISWGARCTWQFSQVVKNWGGVKMLHWRKCKGLREAKGWSSRCNTGWNVMCSSLKSNLSWHLQ